MLFLRKIRGELNGLLQPCKGTDEVKAHGVAFEEKYGQSIWGCCTIYTHETFSSLYNAHLQRCIENEEMQEADDNRKPGILTEIDSCGNLKDFEELIAFVNRVMPDDGPIVWALGEKGMELGHPDYLDDGGMP